MRFDLLKRLQRLFLIVSILMLAVIIYLAALRAGYPVPRPVDLLAVIPPTPARDKVALISGHLGSDSGAICGTDSEPTLQEVDVVAPIAEMVRGRLTAAGIDVLLLEEFDARLTDLDADLLLSLHADSCVPFSGYKAATRANSTLPETDGRLLGCIDTVYPRETGLAIHPNSITHNMTRYHAFRKVLPTTPAVILEMGFLGGDAALLTGEPERVAAGITESVFCFLEGTEDPSAP